MKTWEEGNKGAWEQRKTFHNRFTTQMAENKISNSRVGTDCCQHFWPAPGYVYTAVSHSQESILGLQRAGTVTFSCEI